ncbi:MAG: TIGR00725 family protein, partial [Acidobacteria bacterium]|nr:TIGR00725 family protein [Acidobacteriota bacterium]
GLTIGILPGASLQEGSPNAWVRIAIPTGLGMARNAINVLAADLCVAVGGAAGTLSEVALACKAGRKVWWWRPWRLDPPEGSSRLDVRVFDDETALLRAVEAAMTGFIR